MLLEHGIVVRKTVRGDCRRFGLHGREEHEAHLRELRPERPCGGSPGLVRSLADKLCGTARRVLEERRSDRRRGIVLRQGSLLSPDRLLRQFYAEGPGRGLQSGSREIWRLQETRDRGNQARLGVLSGRRLPSGLLEEEFLALRQLPRSLGPGRILPRDLGRRGRQGSRSSLPPPRSPGITRGPPTPR